MIDLSMDGEIAGALEAWLGNATGVPVIWSEQTSPRPPVPFATLAILGGPTRVGGLDEVVPVRDGTVEIRGRRELTITAEVFADDPVTLLSNALTALCKPSVQQAFESAGMAYSREASGIQNLTQVFEEAYEGRAHMDVTFLVTDVSTDTTGAIESVGITETIETSTTTSVVHI